MAIDKIYTLICRIPFYILSMQSVMVIATWKELRFCSVSNPELEDRTLKFHQSVELSSESHIKFVYSNDRYGCLSLLLQKKVDFGVFQPEDLFVIPLIHNFSSSYSDLKVMYDFRPERRVGFEMELYLFVNKKKVIREFKDFRGASICHPGGDEFGWVFDFSNMFLQFVAGIEADYCDMNLTSYENKVKLLNTYFGDSCLPGPWTPSPYVDSVLKKRYPKLCALCYDNCSTADGFWGSKGAVNCFSMNNSHAGGDVLWLTNIRYIAYYLMKSDRYGPDISQFCTDGTQIPTNVLKLLHGTSKRCPWAIRTFPIILGQKSSDNDITKFISHINSSYNTSFLTTWEYKFRKILLNYEIEDRIYDVEVKEPNHYLDSITNFVWAKRNFSCAQNSSPIIVCTENEDNLHKCHLMKRIGQIFTVDPGIDCILSTGQCLSSLEKKDVDAFVTEAEDLKSLLQLKKYHIIAYQKGDPHGIGIDESNAVVLNTSDKYSFEQLRGKRACFTNKEGMGWNAFLSILLQDESLAADYCRGKNIVLNFFSDVCTTDPDEAQLRKCFSGNESRYTDKKMTAEAEALRCLLTNVGDVAFINYKHAGKYLDDNRDEEWTRRYTLDDLRTICPSKKVPDNSEIRCTIAVQAPRKILIGKNINKKREQEIIFTILIMSSFLGLKNEEDNSKESFRIFTLPRFNAKNTMIIHEDSFVEFESVSDYVHRLGTKAYEVQLGKMLNLCIIVSPPLSEGSSYTIYFIIVLLVIISLLVIFICVVRYRTFGN